MRAAAFNRGIVNVISSQHRRARYTLKEPWTSCCYNDNTAVNQEITILRRLGRWRLVAAPAAQSRADCQIAVALTPRARLPSGQALCEQVTERVEVNEADRIELRTLAAGYERPGEDGLAARAAPPASRCAAGQG
jgi:hypothetical protein